MKDVLRQHLLIKYDQVLQLKFYKFHQGDDNVEYYTKFFELAMRTRLFETLEALTSKYRADLRDDIQDELIGHKFWTVELYHYPLEVEDKLAQKAAGR